MNHRNPTGRCVVAGLGNLLMGDDGVGVHVLRELHCDPPPGVELFDAGTAVWHLVDAVSGAAHVVAIDAVRAGERPGSVVIADLDDMLPAAWHASLHSVSLRDLLQFLPADARRPHVTVIGIEPSRIDYGMELSEVVRAAVPCAAAAVRRILADQNQPVAIHNPTAGTAGRNG